jgi:hypothetical protein
MTQSIDASTRLTVTLAAEQWNVVLDVLQSGPYRMVAPLIQSIASQVQQAAAEVAPRANGPAPYTLHETLPPRGRDNSGERG